MLVHFGRRHWVRVLGCLYPFTTFFVVMGTGNHYLLDVVAGLATLAMRCGRRVRAALSVAAIPGFPAERHELAGTVRRCEASHPGS